MVRILGIVAVAGLAGCGALPSDAPLGPAAGRAFDGAYAGQDTLLSGAAFQCGDASLTERIDIRDGQFAYPFQVNPPRIAPLVVHVGADGGVRGQMQYGTPDDLPFLSRDRTDWVTLEGRIVGPVLDAVITTMRCTRRLVVRRVGGA